MKLLDLFSGIGGFSLAARWMGWETVAFCERDPFCQKVLRKHWPTTLIYDDIHTLPAKFIRDAFQPDIITGGFPCQPFSQAGKRAGKDDDRYLWPAMLEVIATVRPRFVVGENVAGLITMGLDTVLSDLESEGYTCQAVVIPACATGAPHRRDRVWIIAHADSRTSTASGAREDQGRSAKSLGGGRRVTANTASLRCQRPEPFGGSVSAGEKEGGMLEFAGSREVAPNTNQPRTQGRTQAGNARTDGAQSDDEHVRRCEIASPRHAASEGLERGTGASVQGACAGLASASQPDWAGGTFGQPSPLTHWRDRKEWEAFGAVCDVDDGLSARLVRDRVNKLKALGNAVVPQVVYQIFQAIEVANYDRQNPS